MKRLAQFFVGGFLLGAFLLVALAMSLLVSGCASDSHEEQLVGKWQKPGTTESIHFFETGDLQMVRNGEEVTTKYEWLDDSHIHAGGTILEAHIEGDTLTTKTPTKTEIWQRVD